MDYILNTILRLFISLFLVIQSLQVFSQVNVEADRSICTNYTTVIANYPGGTWTTNGGATIINANSTSTLVTNLDQGTNDFTYTVIAVGSDMVTITNNSVTANAGTDRMISCLDYADLSGNAIPTGGLGEWSLKYNTAGVIIDNTASNITQTHNLPFGNTIFVWSLSANGCYSSDEVSINNSKPENNNETDKAGCTNIFYLSAENPPSGGSGQWSIAPGSIGTPTFNNTNTPDVEINAPRGSSVVRWLISYNTCSSYKDFNIDNNLPSPYAGIDQPVCRDTVILDATPPLFGETGVWSVASPQGEIFTDISAFNPTITKVKQGTSTFIWTISNSFCSASDFMQVVNDRPSLNAGADNTICESVYILSADNASPYTGTWSCTNPSVTFDNIHLNQTKVSNLINSTYTFTWTVANGVCTARDNVVIQTFHVPISAGVDKNDCSDTLILSATAIPTGGSGYWSITFGEGTIDNSLSNNTTARNIVDLSLFKWTINSGTCTFTDKFEYRNQLPVKAATQPDIAICSNQALILANPPIDMGESGFWSIVNAAANTTFENPSLYQTQVLNLKQGINTLQWNIYNQYCNTSDILNITNNSIIANAGADASICSNSYSLSALINSGIGYWTSLTPGVVISNSQFPNTAVSNLKVGINSFSWTHNDLGCSAADEVEITNNLPENIFAGSDITVCVDLAHLTADVPIHGSGLWTVISGNGTFTNANSYQTDVNAISPGNNVYRWNVTYNGCSDFDEVAISNKRIDVSAGPNQIICNQPIVSLLGTLPSIGQTGVWVLIGGNGVFSNSSLYNSDVTNLIKGINTFKWTISDLYCTNSAEVTITNNSPDSAKVAADQIICTDITSINAVAVADGIGNWSVVSGGGIVQNAILYNTNVNNIPKGLSTYRWTVNKNGCLLTDDLNVTNNSVDAIIPLSQYNVCSPSHSVTITANQLLSGESGLWTKLSMGSGTIESPGNYSTVISNLANGESVFRWTVNSSICSAYDEVSVIDDYYNASATTVGSADLCVNYGPVIGSTPPPTGKGFWSANQGFITFSNISGANTTVQNLPLGSSTITWTVSSNNCSSMASFAMKNNSITTNAGSDIIGCETTAKLNALPLLAGQTGNWTSVYPAITFSNNQDPNSSISNISIGSSQLTWTISANGCIANDNLYVTNQAFSVSAGNDQTICGTTSSLLGSDPQVNGTGNWSIIEGTGKVTNSAKYNTTIYNLSNGNNVFRWKVIRNGCNAEDDVNIINDSYTAQATAPSNVCIDEVLVSALGLPAGSGASGIWSTLMGGGVFDNRNITETTVRGLSKGDNKFRWTVSKGACVSFKEITVSDNRLSVTAGTDQVICTNYSYLYASPLSSTGTGIWTCDNNAIGILNPNSANTNVDNLSRGINTFKWSAVDKTCTANASISIINNDFTVDAGADLIVKTPVTSLNAQFPGTNAKGQWMVLNGNGFFSDYTNPKTDLSNYTYGINAYRWTVDWNGCNAFDDVNITYDVAEAYAGDDQITCYNSAILLADQPAMGTGIWSLIKGTGQIKDPANYRTDVTNISAGINIFRWTVTAYGAVAFDDVTITNNSFKIYAGPDQQTCSNEIKLDAEAAGIGGAGFWSIFQGSGVFENNLDNTSKVSGPIVGSNLYVWDVVRKGCNSKDTVLIIHYEPTSLSNAGVDATICDKTEYILSANSPTIGKGTWSTTNAAISFLNPAQFNSRVSNLPNGQNTLSWTITNTNCKSVDEVIISARKTVSIVNQPVSSKFNEGENALLSVQISGDVQTYQWQKDGINLVNDGRIDGANQANLTITGLKISDIGNYQCSIIGYCNTLKSGIAAISVISGIDEPEFAGVAVYPNPSKGIVNISILNMQNTKSLSIANLNGEQVFNKINLDKTEIIDLSNLSDGIYIITIKKDNALIKRKLVIQK